jgi:hypothetical protein
MHSGCNGISDNMVTLTNQSVLAVCWSLDTAIYLWNLNKPMNSVKERNSVQQWCAPLPGWFKCNTDGVFYPDQGQGASGVALRNDSGLFVGGRARWYTHGLDALTLEALACRGGAVLAQDKGFNDLFWRLTGANQRSRIASIIRETREISSSFVDFFFVMFTSQSSNRVALLAKQVSGDK